MMNAIDRIFGITPRGSVWRATWTTSRSLYEATERQPQWLVTVRGLHVGAIRVGIDESEARIREEVAKLLAAMDLEA